MAPRGRTRKPRLSRMDAAIDHMSTYGFPEELVRRKVKNLLKVYGGDAGWVFIEADSYVVLLEGILEEVTNGKEENSAEAENMLVDNPPPDERVENPHLLPSVGSSSGVVEQPICLEIINTATLAGDAGSGDCSMHVEEHGKGSKDNNVSKNCSEKEIINGAGNSDGFCVGELHIGNTAAYSPPPPVISPPPVEAKPPRGRRKPSHGWISDGEDDDFINLTPAVRLTPATDKGKKRKTRWDVRPEYM